MNVPRALAPADSPSLLAQPSALSLEDDLAQQAVPKAESNGTLKEAKSAPALSKLGGSLASSFSTLSMQPRASEASPPTQNTTPRPPLAQQETDLDVLAKYSGLSASSKAHGGEDVDQEHGPAEVVVDEGDPLGVTSGEAFKTNTAGLDFAAFASQNAYRDR